MFYRQYLTDDKSSISLTFPTKAFSHFTPGESIDIIDLCILDYINTLYLYAVEEKDTDGPAQFAFDIVDGIFYFEISYQEFMRRYSIIRDTMVDEKSFNKRLEALEKSCHLISSICCVRDNIPYTLYKTTKLYSEIFLGM